MKYILDFDGVIFNTRAFKNWFIDRDIEIMRDAAFTQKVQAFVEDGSLDMESFVFPDARAFIQRHPDVTILSSAKSRIDDTNESTQEEAIAFQEFKIAASKIAEGKQVKIVYDSKREALEEMLHRSTEPTVFVDDTKEHLGDGQGVYERLHAVCMNRDSSGAFEGTLEHGVINSFDALDELVASREETM